MYTLKIEGLKDFVSEDEQEIVYQIKRAVDDGKTYTEMTIVNSFDEDNISEEDIEDFMNQYDLTDQLAIESILETTKFYNFNTKVMEKAELENGPHDYIFENYNIDKKLIDDLMTQNPNYKLATAVLGDNGYLYLSPGRHFVNREGYMLYQTDSGETLTEDYLI